jgi:hypothetical protein
MTTQPILDRIDDLARWLETPAALRQDASGALAVLAEARRSYADLLAALERIIAARTPPELREAITSAGAAAARARGERP